jgi:hypothetical protein
MELRERISKYLAKSGENIKKFTKMLLVKIKP